MKIKILVCTKCKKSFPIQQVYPRCDICNEPLEVEKVAEGKINHWNHLNQTILERYSDFFPFEQMEKMFSLYEGFTPLVISRKLASKLGLKNILFKNESQNPTWSFKDRGTLLGIQHAVTLGYKRIGTVSTGNMAVSVAAYGAKSGLDTFILVSANLPSEKLNPIAIYNPTLIRVEGDYGDLYFKSLEIGKKHNIYFINSDVPIRVEGSKTIAFEICEQMNFKTPDYVVVPTSAGGNLRGILKGFTEFKLCGIIDKIPKIIAAQASGCSPIYNAFINNKNTISPIEKPYTIAHAIENPYPPSGNEVLRRIKQNGGLVTAVSDEEILQAQKRLASEGIFGQPAAAVPLASVIKLRDEKVLNKHDTVVCIVTGSGLKYTDVFKKHDKKSVECKLEDLNELFASTFRNIRKNN